MPLIVVFALICVVAIVCVGAPFGRPSEKQNLSQIPTIEQTDEEILASTTTVEHVCRNYYVSKYDKTNHWNECSICGQKYDVVAHTYTENWTMGESCSNLNKCNHVCSCGYSYQTNNTREHHYGSLRAYPARYYHENVCSVCKEVKTQNCTKEDGSRITCTNLGICTICNTNYSQAKHVGGIYNKNGDIKCEKCGIYIGIVSNLETKYLSSNIFEWSYDFSISSTGNFEGSTVTAYGTNSIKIEKPTKTENTATSIHISGKADFSNYNSENIFWASSYLNNYYVSTNNLVSMCWMHLDISPEIEPPVINPNIVQTNLATSNGWATQKQITVSGTENFCSSVKLTLKDSEGNIYLNNAATKVTDNAWSYTFVPDIEASDTGKQFTITVTDNLGNSANKTFTVQKTDKKGPTITSLAKTSETWTKTKPFTFTATDEGSGGVQISIGNATDYVVATKAGTTYSRAHTFTEEVYGNKDVTVYFKDALGNATSQTFKVYNIDSTKPTITKNEIINNEIVLTGNDRNATLNKEGSGIVKYRYIGSSEENIDVGADALKSARKRNNHKQNTTNRI